MPTYKTAGIILKRTNFGEADRVITLLTPAGKLRAVAKGVRRIKARLAGHLELFSQSELMLAKGRNLDLITSARLQYYPEQLWSDYAALSRAYLLAEMIDKLLDEAEHPELYQLLHDCIKALDAKHSPAAVEAYFRLRLAGALGYQPRLDQCVVCHRPPSGKLGFDVERGGVVHSACSPTALAMSETERVAWRQAPTQALADWQPTELANSLRLLGHFFDYVFGKRFRSSDILAKG